MAACHQSIHHSATRPIGTTDMHSVRPCAPLFGVSGTVAAVLDLRRVCLLLRTRRIGMGRVCSGLPEDVSVIAAVCRALPGEELPARSLRRVCTS